MKHLLALCSILLIAAACASAPPLEPTPDMWQYDDDKFISFKTPIVMSWEYDDPTIGCFEVDRIEKELDDPAEIDQIKAFVEEKNKKGIIKIEKKHRRKILEEFKNNPDFERNPIAYPAKDEREFKDMEAPSPKSGYLYLYRLYAVENCDPDVNKIRSDPADLSVIILDK